MAWPIKVIIPKKEQTFSVSAILENRQITPHGTGAKIIVPKDMLGRDCIVLVR